MLLDLATTGQDRLLVVPLLTAVTRGWAMGWASAPYGRGWAERYPRRAAWMAAAGPGANLVIAALALAGIAAGLASGRFRSPPVANLDCLVEPAKAFASSTLVAFAAKGLSIVCVLNVLLAAFNLVPLPPLDGWRVLATFLSPRALYDLRGIMQYGPFILLALFLFEPYLHFFTWMNAFVVAPVSHILAPNVFG